MSQELHYLNELSLKQMYTEK